MANHKRDLGKERRWRRWIEEQRSSGLSIRAFCCRRGISESNFHQWRRVLAERDRQTPPPAPAGLFVPVEVEASGLDSRIEVALGAGRRVYVPPGFDASTLAQVVAVLEGRSC